MSDTVRRKKEKNRFGYYDWKDEVRNRQGAGDNYFHSDMASSHDGWTKGFKRASNRGRRAETLRIAHKVKVAEDVEVVNIHADDKQSVEDVWWWD